MANIELRKIRGGDRPGIEAVLRCGEFRDDEVDVALELVDESIGGDVDYRIYVAVQDDAVAGYVCFGLTPMTVATYDLYWIAVASHARGQGIASKLVAAMEREIRDDAAKTKVVIASIRVETSPAEGHGAARALYEKLGYVLVSDLPDFYAPGESLYTFYKQLWWPR